MAEVVELFRDGLQVHHEIRVLRYELADLVDEEVQPEALPVIGDIGLDALREHPDVGLVGLLVIADDVIRRALGVAADFVESGGYLLAVEKRRRAHLLPRLPAELTCAPLERLKVPCAVEVVFQLGDMLLVAIEVAAMVVERLDEGRKYGTRFGAPRIGREAVYVEEHAFGRMPCDRGLHG